MKVHALKGSWQDIIASVARIDGDVCEAIVFVDEPTDPAQAGSVGEFFAEMEPYMVDVPDVDDSRDAIYSRADGE